MAVTGLRSAGGAALLAGLVLTCGALVCQAQGNQDIRNRLSDVAVALSSRDPANAMEPFDKSFSNYQKLSDYFIALTSGYQLATEVEVTDEEDTTADAVKVSVRWTLHLIDRQTRSTENRSADLTLQMVKKKGKWKIADLSPLDLFDPQQKAPGR
ncbi:MAG TPA: hypothetical protein VK604_04240 [Bryobacteraceae bacterium]|nr:hypothetical protein [Bryobacteraceae bacterium]